MQKSRVPDSGSTLRDWVFFVEKQLRAARLHYGHGTRSPRDEAVWLLSSSGDIPFEAIESRADAPYPGRAANKALRILQKRIATRKPLAYLLREAWLLGERFYVDERVIVPRSFIAELLPGGFGPFFNASAPSRVLDLCTGSGCLAILAARRFPKAHVDAVDISSAALSVARRNITLHRLSSRIRPLRSDLYEALKGKRYDLVVCNPPYVDSESMRRLPEEYRQEPDLALAGGQDGLDLVDRILRHGPRHLTPNGIMVVEIGHNRRALERRLRTKKVRWLSTQQTQDMVLLVTRAELAEWFPSQEGNEANL